MKKVLIIIVFVFGISCFGVSGKFPIEYQIQNNYHRMQLLLNGDVRWNVSRFENTFTITLTGDESHFIVRNISYDFRDGIIKKFNYKTTLPGTKKIVIELRKEVNDCHIYQDKVSKNLYIEFYPESSTGKMMAKNISAKKPISTTKKLPPAPEPKQTIVNISQLVLDQVEQQPKKESGEQVVPVSAMKPKSANTSSAALWLILVSVSILLTGGGFTVYAYLRQRVSQTVKKSNQNAMSGTIPQFKTFLDRDDEPVVALKSSSGVIVTDNDENESSHSVEFAEQYLRSQGELELQQRLENMSAQSTQKKIGIAIPLLKKKDPTVLAQKLGLSVGELELVTRLQKLHKQHSEEVL